MHGLLEDSPAKEAYMEVTEKSSKKTKGGQKLTWHHIITRDLNTIDIDFKKLSNYQKPETYIDKIIIFRNE